MLIGDASYLNIKTLNLPFINSKRGIESIFKPKEEFSSRELNPGLLRESLTTLPLDYQRNLEKNEKFLNTFDNFSMLLSPVSPVKIGDNRQILYKSTFSFFDIFI